MDAALALDRRPFSAFHHSPYQITFLKWIFFQKVEACPEPPWSLDRAQMFWISCQGRVYSWPPCTDVRQINFALL
jgi:hypothetical protein